MKVDRQLLETVHAVQDRVAIAPLVGVVLEAGDAELADRLRNAVVLESRTIPHLPIPDGRVVLGFVDDVPVACVVGRDPGLPAWQRVHGVRLLARLGVRIALVTEQAGIIEPTWKVGDMMLVLDHLHLATHEGLGTLSDASFTRTPSMLAAYDAALTAELHEVVRTEQVMAARIGTSAMVDVFEGVYANVQDATYETPAQIQMLRAMGAHAVGTSIALEITALRQLGVRAAALVHLTRRAGDEESAPPNPTHLQRLLRGWVVRARRLEG